MATTLRVLLGCAVLVASACAAPAGAAGRRGSAWIAGGAGRAGPRAEQAPPPKGTLESGGATLTVRRDGRFSLARGREVLISDARLVIAGVGWKGSAEQSRCRMLEGYPRAEGGGFVFRGEMEEPTAKATWRFEERVAPAGGGFGLTYEIEPLADTAVAEASLFVDLPVARWRGRAVQLWPAGPGAFPLQRPRQRHFLSGRTPRVVLDAGASPQVTLDFARPTLCTVQDTREFGGQVYQVYPRLFAGGRAAKGRKFRLELTLMPDDKRKHATAAADWSSKEPLRAAAPKPPTKPVPLYKRMEIDLDVAGTYPTPFDPDQIRVDGHVRCPSGRELIVPAFFSQGFELRRGDGESWLDAVGKPGWKLRFAPIETGKHSLYVTAKDKTGQVRSEAATFEAVASDDPGYVRVSRQDPRYFAFDTGRPYFAVGENVCTWRKDVTDYDRWFPRLGRAGGNYARVWMWGHCFGIEWGRPGVYRLESAWELDRAMALAEQHGIYVKLCLEAWRGFGGSGSFVPPGLAHPYSRKNGGPCDKEMDVFTDPEARRMFRNRLRYVVARWGYSTHILAWEFWNEIDCVRGYRDRSQDVIAWSAEMGRYLRQIDPWRHLVVNSLGSFQLDERLWKLPEMDFAQVHGYWHPTLAASKDTGKDMAEMVPQWIGRIRGYGKPALFAEYGLVNERWGPSPRADEDTDGVHLHNGLWSSVMSGAAGTAMLWWWGDYVDPQDLYYHFTGVARFVDSVPWTTAGFGPAKLQSDSTDVRAMGLTGRKIALVWLQNRRHTWWNVVEKQPVPPIKAATVTLSGLQDGEHEVQWWDTWKGAVTKRQSLTAREGKLVLAVADLKRDVAVKVSAK